jgi:mannose-6-phosphate isomerase-like protein (cupin superfamily)
LFLALRDRLTIHMSESDVELGPREMFVVPVGIEHQPLAADEAKLLLTEPSGTPNPGDATTAAADAMI